GCQIDATINLDLAPPGQPGSTLPSAQDAPGSVTIGASVTLDASSAEQLGNVLSRLTASPAQQTQEANFRLLISDEQNAIGDFAHLWVTIDRVGMQRGGEQGRWVELQISDERNKIDLVGLTGDAAEELIMAQIPSGRYSKVFIHVDDVYGELLSGAITRVKLPSDKLQIVKPFEVQQDSITSFVFDITVIAAGNPNSEVRYILKPVIGESGANQPFVKRVRIKDTEGHDEDEDEADHDEDDADDEHDANDEDEDDENDEHDADDEDDESQTSPVAIEEHFFLEIVSPEGDTIFVESPTTVISGLTRVDAVVSVNDDLVDVDEAGFFKALVKLEEGPNIIEVVASVAGGEEEFVILTVFYLPESGE
ncbi:MAG: DUF4382 domain-containing protein, partial [Chloroflexi bacterium]|nr:DUF4382 domain-containing protein [Chloroflexota bacterium]